MKKSMLLGLILFFLSLLLNGVAQPVVAQEHSPVLDSLPTHDSNPRIRLKNGTSLNWAGYALETSLTNPKNYAVSDVQGSWIVPTVICDPAKNTYSAVWLGIDGYSDNSVEQTGTSQDCINGQPRYSAWYEMYPKPSFRANVVVRPGDSISARVQYNPSSRKFVLMLTNNTTGQSFTTSQKSNALRQSAEWIAEAPWSGGVLPLANFGSVTFTNAQATLNGVTGPISNWPYDAITMTDSTGSAKATPSALSNGGTSFSVTWNAN